jgi:bifunctional non-homologous end joining protein LigD
VPPAAGLCHRRIHPNPREVLWKVGLESFPKLTGGKGLHVVVPLNGELSFSVIKSAAKVIAERVREFNPGRFLLASSKAKRTGKIYLDYLRNGQGATAIAPYSVRTRAGAPVSVPIGWKEIKPGPKSDAYSIKNLPKHVSRGNGDPLERVL